MSQERDTATPIYPVIMDLDGLDNEVFTDFRPVIVPADTPEEEVPDPKDESVLEPADSPASPTPPEPTPPVSPAPPPAAKVNTPPRASATGS